MQHGCRRLGEGLTSPYAGHPRGASGISCGGALADFSSLAYLPAGTGWGPGPGRAASGKSWAQGPVQPGPLGCCRFYMLVRRR